MITADLITLVTRDVPNNLQSDNTLISDSIYRAVTEMQEDTYCSILRGQLAVSSSSYKLTIATTFYGTDYDSVTKPNNKFNVIPVRIDAIWLVNSDGTLTAVFLLDNRTVQYQKDAVLIYEDYYGIVETEGVNTVLRTPYDQNGYTFEFWLRYKIPYIQSAFTNTVTIGANTVDIRNSLLETIPERYQDLLTRGIKYHFYNSLMEKTNTQEFAAVRQLYGEEWYNKILPRVKQESLKPIAKEVTFTVVVPQIFDQND